MDRRPLLSSSTEPSSRRPPPPQPLLPPSQVDASLIVFEDDDVGGTHHAAGPTSDARNSIFSSLSFSAWSDNSGAAAAPPSYLTAVLLRPFQRLRFWCRDGERGQWCGSPSRCWCCCRGRRGDVSPSASRGAFHDSEHDAFDAETSDAVAAGALRASGVSRASQRSKSNGTPTTTSPQHGASSSTGSAGRQHRQYAPPRSHSVGGGAAVLASPLEPAGAAQDTVQDGQNDSAAESSLAGSSTPPSSMTLGRVVTAPGEQLVMQRGVLMRIALDGTCTRVEDTTTSSAGGAGGSGRQEHHVPRTSSLEETHGRADAQHMFSPWGTDPSQSTDPLDAHNPYAVATAMGVLESSRQPLHTPEQLSSSLARFAPYIPLRVEAEVDLNSVPALPAGGATDDAVSHTSPVVPSVPLCLHILGPVQACPTPTALRILEDVLLEDCDQPRVSITALHYADLDVRGVALGGAESSAVAGMPARAGRLGGGGGEDSRQSAQSNAYLDLLLSPVVPDGRGDARGGSAVGRGGGDGGVYPTPSTALTATAAATHVLAFLNTVVKGRGSKLTTMHFTRCFVAPHDVARFVPLPLSTLRRLRYEQCSLTPAHIDALLTLARHQDAERRNVARGSEAARGRASFAVLEELQLSGPLTSECIAELLDYVEEQQLQAAEVRGGPVSLHQLILPGTLVRAAKEHPFVRANYQRISVVSAQ